MEVMSKDNVMDTLAYMMSVIVDSPEDSYFVVGDCTLSQIDKEYQERSHKMGIERAKKQQEELEAKQKEIAKQKDNI